MLPRYSPSFTERDLREAFVGSRRGPSSELLRKKLSDLFGTPQIFLFSRARSALCILLKAFGRPGETILPAYTCAVVPEAVSFAGYKPKFVDIDPDSYNPTSLNIKRAITPRTTAIIITHQFGIPSQWDAANYRKQNGPILFVEDAAAALGARHKGKLIGTFGDAAIISFDKVKVVAGMRGGALIVNESTLADRVTQIISDTQQRRKDTLLPLSALLWKWATNPTIYRLWRRAYVTLFGEAMYEVAKTREDIPEGYFAGMSDFAARLVAIQLDNLEGNLARRRAIAAIYATELTDCPGLALPRIPGDSLCSWIQYPIRTSNRLDLYRFMKGKGVDLSWTFRYSCAESYNDTSHPNSLSAARSVLGLPTYPSLTDFEAQSICRLIREYSEVFRRKKERK
jgi:perosamine synthetase